MCWRYLLLRPRLSPTRSYGATLFSCNTTATANRRRIKTYKLVFQASNFILMDIMLVQLTRTINNMNHLC
jgi:hypothetical protein